MSEVESLYLEGQLLGHIRDVEIDMYHWHGRWLPEKTELTNAFHQALEKAMARWEEDIAGIEAFLDPECTEIVEVTSIEDGIIDFNVYPRLWPSFKRTAEQKPIAKEPEQLSPPWWQFWKK